MGRSVSRAARAAGIVLLSLCAAPFLASAQTSDSSDDETSDLPISLSDLTIMQSTPTPFEFIPAVPEDDFDDALAQAPAAPIKTVSTALARFPNSTNRFEMHEDGSVTETLHVEVQLLSPQAVQAGAQPALGYSETMDDLQIKDAYTLKQNGTRLDVSPGAILVRQKAVPQPFYTDIKEKVILFPNVEVGDTIIYDVVLQSKPRIPGQFYYSAHVARDFEIDNATATFVAPKDHPLTFDLYGLDLQKSVEGDKLVYTVHYVNHTPVLELPQYLSDLDRGLRVFASSVDSYDAMAAAYAPLALPKAAVTPKIAAKAEEITAGVTDRREQARKLYEWVSAHVRYVAILLGDGGLVPHDAETTLTNAFGDCKDHAVLYSALLKAKGIPSELVILNGSNGYVLPHIPELGSFNHVIVWLPEFQMYADTTSDATPFGSLPLSEYGKSVVHVGGTGKALHQIPVLAERDSTYASSSDIKLDGGGNLSVKQTATASGALSGAMRTLVNQLNVAGPDALAANVLSLRKMAGAMGSFNFPATTELTPQFTYSSSYQIAHLRAADMSFSMPEGLNIANAFSSVVLGPVASPLFVASDPVPCFGGDVSDDYNFEIPANRRLAGMPQDGDVETANISYRSHWSMNGNTLSVRREMHAHFDKALCAGPMLHETRLAIAKIIRDYATPVTLKLVPAT